MKKLEKSIRYILITLICLICMLPFIVLFYLSINKPSHSYSSDSSLLPDFYFKNYVDGVVKSHIGNAITNSAIITISAVVIIVIFGAMAGYAVARHRNAMNRSIFTILLCCMMIPGIINTVPLYVLMKQLNAINTLWGMACVCATLALPQSVFIFSGFIRGLPVEIEEAALIDGCSQFKIFWYIIMPLLKPAISAVIILNGFGIWNNYSQAVFFLQDSSKHNIAQALSVYFQQFGGAHWNLMAATSVIAIIPVIVAFICFQKQLMEGLTEGAVKG